MNGCVDPNAEQYPCVVCGRTVYTCEDIRGNPCPVHPDGVETENGWVCSDRCWDILDEMSLV